jgi:hypothetical protein
MPQSQKEAHFQVYILLMENQPISFEFSPGNNMAWNPKEIN